MNKKHLKTVCLILGAVLALGFAFTEYAAAEDPICKSAKQCTDVAENVFFCNKRAYDYLQQALKYDDRFAPAYRALGGYWEEQKDLEAASQAYLTAIMYNQKDEYSYRALMHVYCLNNDTLGANGIFEKFKEMFWEKAKGYTKPCGEDGLTGMKTMAENDGWIVPYNDTIQDLPPDAAPERPGQPDTVPILTDVEPVYDHADAPINAEPVNEKKSWTENINPSGIKALVMWMIVGMLAVALYLFPLIVAVVTKHPNVLTISLINLFLGWSGIGWLAALIMTLRKREQPVEAAAAQGRSETIKWNPLAVIAGSFVTLAVLLLVAVNVIKLFYPFGLPSPSLMKEPDFLEAERKAQDDCIAHEAALRRLGRPAENPGFTCLNATPPDPEEDREFDKRVQQDVERIERGETTTSFETY